MSSGSMPFCADTGAAAGAPTAAEDAATADPGAAADASALPGVAAATGGEARAVSAAGGLLEHAAANTASIRKGTVAFISAGPWNELQGHTITTAGLGANLTVAGAFASG